MNGKVVPNETGFVNAEANSESGLSRYFKVPNNFIGLLLDHEPPVIEKGRDQTAREKALQSPRAGAYAIFVLLVKLAYFDADDRALNEKHLATRYGIGRRQARAAFHKLQEVGIITRQRAGRTWAKEHIIKARSTGHVRVGIDSLNMMSPMARVFAVVANLSPNEQSPEAICERIGITSRDKTREIWREAVAAGAVAERIGPRKRVLVARVGSAFDVAANVPIKRDIDVTTDVPTMNVPTKDVPTGDVPTQVNLESLFNHTERNTEKSESSSAAPAMEEVVAHARDYHPFDDDDTQATLRRLILEWDRTEAVASHLLKPAGLARLLRMIDQDGKIVLVVLRTVLTRELMADTNRPPLQINSWRYLDKPLKEQKGRLAAAENSQHPGDRLNASWRDRAGPLDAPF